MKPFNLKNVVKLALPERGMPVILSTLIPQHNHDIGWETVIARSRRVNGLDEAAPSAVFMPVGGMGFFGWPAIQGHRNGKSFVLEPGNWRMSAIDDGVALIGGDADAGIAIELHFSSRGFRATDVLLTSVKIINAGETPYVLDRCMAGSILIAGGAKSVKVLTGSWGREFHCQEQALGTGLWLQESRRGRTSHDKQPTLTIRSSGDRLYRLHLGWSGNHVMAIDRLDDGQSLVHAGELFEPGEVILQPGDSYHSPTLYAASSEGGEAALADVFHETLFQMSTRPNGKTKPRPVILNTWEGTYFDHDVEKLKAQATVAQEIGIERFVLDDGWFGRRDSDNAALGDWFVDERKYPDGLKPLIDHVTGLGMEFGIWVEPEMVNPDSDLYRAHPDWVLQVKGKPLLLSRQQLALDLTNPDVFDYLWSRLDWLLSNHAIAYLKWDMNRDLTHPGDSQGRAATSRQTRAAYALMDKVREAHPHVEIESCASGGGRADFGVLARTQRVWVSDSTDALERLEIQRGARDILSPAVMGCHISASPNHQTQRRHTLAFRAIVAFFGHLGVELDPTKVDDSEREELKLWIALHKELRPLLHSINSHTINEKLADGRYLFGAYSRYQDHGAGRAIVAVAQGAHPLREQPEPLRFPIHDPSKTYVITRLGPGPLPAPRSNDSQRALLTGGRVSGHLIANHGLPIPQLYPESAILLEIKTAEDT